MLVIRKATAADATLIVDMIRELADFEHELEQSSRPLQSGTANPQHTRSISSLIRRGRVAPACLWKTCLCEPSFAAKASARRFFNI
jgi:hypothetical protein